MAINCQGDTSHLLRGTPFICKQVGLTHAIQPTQAFFPSQTVCQTNGSGQTWPSGGLMKTSAQLFGDYVQPLNSCCTQTCVQPSCRCFRGACCYACQSRQLLITGHAGICCRWWTSARRWQRRCRSWKGSWPRQRPAGGRRSSWSGSVPTRRPPTAPSSASSAPARPRQSAAKPCLSRQPSLKG